MSTDRLMQVDLGVVFQQRLHRDRIISHSAGIVFPNARFPDRALLTSVVGRIEKIV